MNSTHTTVESGKDPDADHEFFVAKIVENDSIDESPRIRFGIGTLMIVTAVLGGQYALISYLGAWSALVLPPLICLGTVAVVLIVHIAGRTNPDPRARNTLAQKSFQWGFLYVIVLGFSAYLTGGAQLTFEYLSNQWLEQRVQRNLGFNHVAQFGMIHVTAVTPGSACEMAEFQIGDTIVTELKPNEYIRMLDDSRGQMITVTVASGALTRALDDCPKRELTLVIP